MASSPPAGYFALEINGGSDNHVSLPLFRAASTHAKVTAVAPDRIICAASKLTPNRFAAATALDGSPRGAFYAEFTSGRLKGVSYRVLGNSADTIVLETKGDDLTAHPSGALAFGDTIRIRPAWTIAAIFGATDDEVVIEKQPDPSVIGDSVLLYDQAGLGTNKAPNREFFYVAGQGWRAREEGTADMAEQPLRKGEPFLVRRNHAEDVNVVVVGVPLREQAVVFVQGASATVANDSYVSLVHTEPVSLNESGLVNAATPARSIVQESPSLLRRTDLVLEWTKGQAGFHRAPDRIYYYLAGAGWRQAGSASTTVGHDASLVPGRAYVVRKWIGNAGNNWVQSAPAAE